MRNMIKQKAFRSFLLSLLCIFVLPTLVAIYFMNGTLQNAKKEEQVTNQLLLEQYKNAVDGQMFSIKRIGDTLSVDEKALLFSTAVDERTYLKSATTFQAIRSLMQQIATTTVANDNIALAYLYFPRSGKIISTTTMDAPVFFQRRMGGTFLSYDDFVHFLHQSEDGFLSVGNTLYYLRTNERSGELTVASVIALDARFFSRYDELLPPKAGYSFSLLSPQGEVLYSSSDQTGHLTGLDPSAEFVDVDGARLLAYQSVSADTDCRYVITVPEQVFAERLFSLQLLYTGLIALLLVLGIVLSFALAKRRYAPIRQLRDIVGDGAPADARDDFLYLQEMVGEMKTRQIDTTNRLAYTTQRMSHYLLQRLLRGAFTSAAALEEQLLLMDISFPSDAFALVSVRLDPVGDTEADGSKVITVLEELLASYSPRAVVMDEAVYFILSVGEDEPSSDVAEALTLGYDMLTTNYQLPISIILSRLSYGLDEIRYLYHELCSEWSEAQKEPFLRFPWYDRAVAASDAANEIEAATHRLASLILVGAKDDLAAGFEEVRAACKGKPAWKIRMSMTTLLSGCVDGLSMRLTPAEMKRINTLVQHYVVSTVGPGELDSVYPVLAEMIAVAPVKGGKAKSDSLAQAAHKYIEENYTSNEMSIQSIADHLGLTASYCSQLYKKQTGRAMLDDISRMRIDKAKTLLKETALGLEAIAEQVGFLNSSTFIRAFKKAEGITPGQYRSATPRE